MTRALHDQDTGYYSQKIRSIGHRGDFTTIPEHTSALAKSIAAWASLALRKHKTRHLIELGPGNGTLAKEVRSYLPLLQRTTTKLHLVESSASLRNVQNKLLGSGATFHKNIQDALKATNGSAVIYSNEFVDAFPVRVFENSTGSHWQEVCIEGDLGNPKERFIPISNRSLPSSKIFQQKFSWPQRVEVHESYALFLSKWLPSLKAAEVLTIDYGDTAALVYQRRPKGSLRAYFHHTLRQNLEVYKNSGYQDITADVNFSDLRCWSEPWLKEVDYGSLSEFIAKQNPDETPSLSIATNEFRYLIQETRS